MEEFQMLIEYKNEPLTDFSISKNKSAFEEALKRIDSEKGEIYPIIIGGEKIYTEKNIVSINPSKNDEVIGSTATGTAALAEKAVIAAEKAFKTWKNVSVKERANYLFNIAAIIRRRKHEFSALLTEEAGKIWAEADGDTAEAIDFLEYYGRQALVLEKGMPLASCEGEQNECNYIPLGVGIVIAPWNFPLAILVGMTAAAIVAGNTVVLKPSSLAPIIAAKFMEVLEEVRLPEGVVNFLPGPGKECGDYLVAHPKTRFINFTGSMEVGLNINKLASQTVPGQKWMKRVVAEMGGKNGIIVDSEADLDAAADGIVTAAFGFQGQKCSACSRAIIVEDVYEELTQKIIEKTKVLKVGPAREFGINMTAVIDKSSYEKTLKYIEIGKSEGTLLVGGVKVGENGYFISPTVFGNISKDARLSQEEVFGPVLSLIKAKNFDDAIEIANNTMFGLTGAVFTKNRSKIEKAKREFHVGNLYINRKCTGALVGTEPFGGFNMSGTDSKAGGSDYLLLFMQAKTVGEMF
jgi:1-pyrroline-5-carboxylate dehydrogenase